MPIEFNCKSCSTTLRVPDEHLGKQARCPKCQTLNIVQSADSQAAAFGSAPDAFESTPSSIPTANPYGVGQGSVLPPGGVAGHRYPTAHRGAMILTLGIMSFVCNVALVPGILAWIMGRGDLKQMDTGQMDPEGRGLTQAGMILGIISTVLFVLVLLLYAGFFILFLVAAAAQ